MPRTAMATQAEHEKGSASQSIRERLLSGDPISVPQLAEEHNVTKGLVTAVLMKFRTQGYDVTTVSKPYKGRRVKHYIVTPRTTPVDQPQESAPAPTLGQMLTVSLLALGPKGELRIGLRDETNDTTFVCTVDNIG